jgi:hypothetical protein
VAFGGDAKTTSVYDVSTFEQLQVWRHSNTVRAVALSPDGELCVSGDYDGIVIVRSVDTGDTVFEFRFQSARDSNPPFIWSVQMSRDGSRLAAGCWNNEVRVWETDTWTLACPIIYRQDRVFSIALAQNGSLVGVGDRTGRAALYRLEHTGTTAPHDSRDSITLMGGGGGGTATAGGVDLGIRMGTGAADFAGKAKGTRAVPARESASAKKWGRQAGALPTRVSFGVVALASGTRTGISLAYLRLFMFPTTTGLNRTERH